MKKNVIYLLLIIVVGLGQLELSGFSGGVDRGESFYFDAICFRNMDKETDRVLLDTVNKDGRVDVFMLIPYQTLTFEKNNELFGAKYEIIIEVYDSNGALVENFQNTKIVREKEYFVTQGGDAGYSSMTAHFLLNEGNYDIRAILKDQLSGDVHKKSRKLTVINFDRYRFALSGIMLVSSIEEIEGSYKITPHLSDNVGDMNDGFFIFYEAYNNSIYDSVSFAYILYDYGGKEIERSSKITLDMDSNSRQLYRKIVFPNKIEPGIYKARLLALLNTGKDDFSEDDYLAITERSLNYYSSKPGYYEQNIDIAIRYLRYVARSSDIDYIESGKNDQEKRLRYEEFWKTLDPSPETKRNEAYDEYYARIEYANKNFRSYAEGWLTDRGMVYIIFGHPDYSDHSRSYNGRTVYIKWTYVNNRQFIFADETGLGDYRLTSGIAIGEKYRYDRR